MAVYCCVPTCKGSGKVKKHLLPRDPQLRRIWCQAIGRMDLVNIEHKKRSSYRVCDAHFAEMDKFIPCHNRTNLKLGAVPTLKLPDDKSIFQKDKEAQITQIAYAFVARDSEKSASTSTFKDHSYCSPHVSQSSTEYSSRLSLTDVAPNTILHHFLTNDGNESFDNNHIPNTRSYLTPKSKYLEHDVDQPHILNTLSDITSESECLEKDATEDKINHIEGKKALEVVARYIKQQEEASAFDIIFIKKWLDFASNEILKLK